MLPTTPQEDWGPESPPAPPAGPRLTPTYLTDSVKPPGQLALGLTRKLPCRPLDKSSLSASTPLMLG